jgi:predicted acyltransferase
MLAANCVNVFLRRVPATLAHNQGDVLRLFDLPAPAFQFLVGVSLVLFLRNRRAAGRSPVQARVDATRRFVLLMLLGMLLDSVGALHFGLRWGVLQTLALGGLAATALADMPDELVAAVAIALLGPYSGAWNSEVHGSPDAALAFVPLTLAGLLVGRAALGNDPRRALVRRGTLVSAAAGALAAALYAAGIPFNKLLGTSSFVALTTAVSAAGVAAAAALEARTGRLPRPLVATGQFALSAWVLQYLLVYYPAWLVFPGWRRLAFVPGMVAIAATTTALCWLSVALGRRGIRIRL